MTDGGRGETGGRQDRPHDRDASCGRHLEQLLASLAGYRHLGLAVSGGADSTALMHLAARWRRRLASPPEITVLTVDHRLRPTSCNEALSVEAAARALGFAHRTLVWQQSRAGSAVQERARAARYALLETAMRQLAIDALVTAHHADDQAETLLMRLARGSGLDGLAGMAPATPFGPGMLVRPMLSVGKDELTRWLGAAGIAWSEDPSNELTAFERARLRRIAPTLAGAGLGTAALAMAARRLARARQAIESAVDAFLATEVRIDPTGLIEVDAARLAAAPEEIAVRAMQRLIAAAAGRGAPAPLGQTERTLARLLRPAAGQRVRATLAGAVVTRKGGRVTLQREPGRAGLPRLTVAPGQTVLWDGRFMVTHAAADGQPLAIGALGRGQAAREAVRGRAAGGMPVAVLATLPAYTTHDGVMSLPRLLPPLVSRPPVNDGGRAGCAPWAVDGPQPVVLARFVNSPLRDWPKGDIDTV
ncbi:MAG: tRNA lysidine(34) synthetase TilS [Hyphomicrobiaceae bacterium]